MKCVQKLQNDRVTIKQRCIYGGFFGMLSFLRITEHISVAILID